MKREKPRFFCRETRLPSDRKGNEMMLRTTGMMLFYAIILILIIGMVYSLIELFIAGEEDYRAKQNFKYFTERLETTIDDGLEPPESSVILQLPENYLIAGFNAGEKQLTIGGNGSFWDPTDRIAKQSIGRPSRCDDEVCICLFRTGLGEVSTRGALVNQYPLTTDLVVCADVSARTIQGTFGDVAYEKKLFDLRIMPTARGTVDGMQTYDLLFGSSEKATNLKFKVRSGAVLVYSSADDASSPSSGTSASQFEPEGGGFGGAGATGGWDCSFRPVAWNGADPYMAENIWGNTRPELKEAYDLFNDETGSKQEVISTYRPQAYQDHIRTVWDAWQFVNGKPVTVNDASCANNGRTIAPPDDWDAAVCQEMKDALQEEIRKHELADTRPWCISDHAAGIAIDIRPPAVSGEAYREWMRTASSLPAPYTLCHYIAGDEPHFALLKYLSPAPANCLVP